MIKLFCKNLPRNLSNLLYNEYFSYEKDLKFLLNTYPKKYFWTININYEYFEIFLSLAIFYRRIIVHLDSAVDFSRRFFLIDNIKGIRIRGYILDKNESIKLEKVVNHFRWLCQQYNISYNIFDFDNMEQFLANFKKYYKNVENANI